MIIKTIHRVKLSLQNCLDRINMNVSMMGIHRKFKEKKRVDIWSKIHLTDEQKREVNDFYKENYGKKVSHIWHRHFTAFTGCFDVKYFPETLYIPKFEHYMNLNKAYNDAFSDKNVLPVFAEKCGVKIPETVLQRVCGLYRDANGVCIDTKSALEILSDTGEVFIKPTVDSSSGRGCFVANFAGGIDTISKKTVEELLASVGDNVIVQRRVKCHESLQTLYAESVNTFRVMTYRWNESIYFAPAILRIGQGGAFVDNAHAGGMFIAVDKNGRLHETAFTEFKQEFKSHPDTKTVFKDYTIELFPNVLKAAKKMHDMMPQIGVANWDFTIDETGEPVLIEVNINNGSVWLFEMAHGVGAFEERTEEVLGWIRKMDKLPASKRKQFRYGKSE